MFGRDKLEIEANAELIVRAVNSHYKLLATAKAIADAIEKKADIGKRRRLTVSPLMEETLKQLRAAIREGESGV